MKLASQLATARQYSSAAGLDQVHACCRLAKEMERAGEYERAREALREFWPEKDASPRVEGLDGHAAAEVLLRVGTLVGWVGGANQSQRQELAKDLITRSIEIFTQLQQLEKVAEAQSDLALCYWREGAFDEARVHLALAVERLGNERGDLKATALIRLGTVEVLAGRFGDALQIYERARPLIEQSNDNALKGSFNLSRATVFSRLANDTREDYLDRALESYAAASMHFEQAGHMRQCGRVENNLGFLYESIGNFPEAYKHINRARDIFLSLGDQVHVAQVDDTRARAFLAEGRFREAERYARAAVRTLERGDECSLLVEALTTLGITLARLGNYSSSRAKLNRAVEVGENCGDLEGAGRAKLSIIEELPDQTSVLELASIYQSAAELLKRSQDPSATQRLVAASSTVIEIFLVAQEHGGPDVDAVSWEGFSLRKELRAFEKTLLERALRDAGGSVTTASRLLGFRHHQSLISLINTRYQDLLNKRSAVRKRRQPIFAKPGYAGRRAKSSRTKADSGQTCVLHIEDNKGMAQVIDDYLTTAGMDVDSCANGMTALRILTGDTHYDVVVVDHDLPGLTGLELVRRTRKITHRRNTPIIMLSGDDIETEAWRAGVQEFLRKPKDIDRVASTVERLLREKHK